MEILQTVIVKQILTETSKQKLLQNFNVEKLQLQKECEQLQFEQKKLEYKKSGLPSSLQSYLKEIKLREEKIKMLEFRMEQLRILPLGSEIKQSEIQGITRIQVGDVWESKVKTIIIEDGIVVEIR